MTGSSTARNTLMVIDPLLIHYTTEEFPANTKSSTCNKQKMGSSDPLFFEKMDLADTAF